MEEIQDDIETELMKEQAFEVAKAYVRYRYKHEMKRNGNGIDRKILTIVDGVNEEVIQENSNKNPTILSTQRDYIAGEISKDITRNTLLEVYTDYVCGSFTKTVCEAKNKNQLLKAKAIADELGLVEDIDYGCIYDNCLTELEPEEDNGTTLTGIWFCPLDDEIAHKISKKYQLYK